ncbi:MAG: ankyrin repeat domain-containing protein [Legionellales bacterium]|nr:ankyrin repeat domain-containing protein [Legionellales bacterium]
MFDRSDLEQKFWVAAGNGSLGLCQSLVEQQKVDINACNSNSRTALHWAALHNKVDVVRYLIKNGAVLMEDSHGFTPYDLTKTP